MFLIQWNIKNDFLQPSMQSNVLRNISIQELYITYEINDPLILNQLTFYLFNLHHNNALSVKKVNVNQYFQEQKQFELRGISIIISRKKIMN